MKTKEHIPQAKEDYNTKKPHREIDPEDLHPFA